MTKIQKIAKLETNLRYARTVGNTEFAARTQRALDAIIWAEVGTN